MFKSIVLIAKFISRELFDSQKPGDSGILVFPIVKVHLQCKEEPGDDIHDNGTRTKVNQPQS